MFQATVDVGGQTFDVKYDVTGDLLEVDAISLVVVEGIRRTTIDFIEFYDDFASFAEAVDAACQEDYDQNHEETDVDPEDPDAGEDE